MKRFVAFLLTLALVTTLSAAVGCGNKGKSTTGGTAPATVGATTSVTTGK